MRILFIAHDADDYGASKSLLTLIKYFSKHKYNIHVILPETGVFIKELELMKVDYTIIPFIEWVYPKHHEKETFSIACKNYIKRKIYLVRCLYNYKQVMPLFKLTANIFQPDVIYTNTITHPMGLVLSKILKKPHVWHIREFMEEDHNRFFVFGLGFVKYFLRLSTRNIYISEALRNKFETSFNEKTVVIQNGILNKEEITNYQLQASSRSITQPLSLLSVGRISSGKRHDVAISVLAELINCGIKTNLTIAGRGDISELKKLSKKLKVESHILFSGHVNNVWELYKSHNILIVASEMEGFGRVTAEAMATGMVVIGRNSGGTGEIINNKINGFLFDKENEIISIIIELLNNPSAIKSIGEKANRKAISNYNIESYCIEVEKIINTLE